MQRPVLIALLAFVLSSCGGPKAPAEKLYRLGDKAQAGSLVYTISHAEWHDSLGDRRPNQRFLVVNVAVTNGGSSALTVPTMELVDAAGKTYSELSDGKGADDWLGALRRVEPVQTERGTVLFDVPPANYRLRVRYEAEPDTQASALVELPYLPGL
jgi:hypothetical protein